MVIVDLDRNRVTGMEPVVPLPNRAQLYHSIRVAVHPELTTLGHIIPEKKSSRGDDFLAMRRVFLDYFAFLFMNWKSFVVQLSSEDKGETNFVFSKPSFLESLQKDQAVR